MTRTWKSCPSSSPRSECGVQVSAFHASKHLRLVTLPQRRTREASRSRSRPTGGNPPRRFWMAAGSRNRPPPLASCGSSRNWSRTRKLGSRIVPHSALDEARHFGMEACPSLGIYSPSVSCYEPVDKDQVMFYRGDKEGSDPRGGINEAGAMSSWMLAATGRTAPTTPAPCFAVPTSSTRCSASSAIGRSGLGAGDSRAKPDGGTAGRTTLNGEVCSTKMATSHISLRPSPTAPQL